MTVCDNTQLEHQHHQPNRQRHCLQLLVHNLDGPNNVGGLFRLADALGLERLVLTGSTPVPPNRKLRLTSRATENFVPFEYHAEPIAVISSLKNDGYRILALEITSASVDIRELDLGREEKVCLVLGNESTGINPLLLSACDNTVHIPMQGSNSSMNVAMAAGISCFEILRGRLAAS